LGATIVVVTHELASIFTIADSALFLDVKTKRAISDGNPHDLVENAETPSIVRDFLLRKPSA
jgi:phospholipid/cholesterol/gamma-HCH transport system ATP-binding protein